MRKNFLFQIINKRKFRILQYTVQLCQFENEYKKDIFTLLFQCNINSLQIIFYIKQMLFDLRNLFHR